MTVIKFPYPFSATCSFSDHFLKDRTRNIFDHFDHKNALLSRTSNTTGIITKLKVRCQLLSGALVQALHSKYLHAGGSWRCSKSTFWIFFVQFSYQRTSLVMYSFVYSLVSALFNLPQRARERVRSTRNGVNSII